MMPVEILIIVSLLGSALIHLIPLVGALGPQRVARLYDVAVEGPDLALLLVHRAILFGILGAALVAAIFCDQARLPAIGAVLVSDVAFLVIAGRLAGLNDALKRVVRADVVSIGLLIVAGVAVLAS